MAKRKRPFIIEIEGTDGSGKETQSKLLKEWLESVGYKTELVSFPRYEQESSIFVKKYLNGDYGTNPNDVDPRKASMLFSFDRMISFMSEDWGKYFKSDVEDAPDVIVFDRYAGSNMIHQACKYIQDKNDDINNSRPKVEWLTKNLHWIEYSFMGLPKPNLVLFLNMPCWASQKLRENRLNKITGDTSKDIHERDENYLKKVYAVSAYICFLENWTTIPCTESIYGAESDILSIETVQNSIREEVKKKLNIKE